MKVIYNDIADIINKTMWDILLEDNKELHIPFYYQKYPERKPFYSENTKTLSKSSATLHDMIMFANAEIMFAFVDREDLLTAFTYLKTYTDTLSKYTVSKDATNDNVRYLKKCEFASGVLKDMADGIKNNETTTSSFKHQPGILDILKML